MFQGFLQSRLKWGLNIEQLPCYHHYEAQSEVLTQSLGLVNAFSTATVLSNVGKLLMNSQKLRSFLRLVRHTFIRPDTPELCLVIDCFLLWWTAANICCLPWFQNIKHFKNIQWIYLPCIPVIWWEYGQWTFMCPSTVFLNWKWMFAMCGDWFVKCALTNALFA